MIFEFRIRRIDVQRADNGFIVKLSEYSDGSGSHTFVCNSFAKVVLILQNAVKRMEEED
jgi:hypothetical protein